MYPGSSSLSSLQRASSPRLFSSIFSLLFPPFAGIQGKWQQRNFVLWPFKRLSASPAVLPGWQNPYCFSQLDIIRVPFQLWWCRLGRPTWGLDTTFLRGNTLATEISLWHFSCHLWEPSQPSRVSSTLPTSHIALKCFILSIRGCKASLQLVFSWLFKMISLQFSCNSRLVLGEG